MTAEVLTKRPADVERLPARLHHTARVVRDQEVTRRFYEDLLGMPLIATWAEAAELPEFPGRKSDYCHTFFALADGSALAFFQMAEPEQYEVYRAKKQTVFNHLALFVSAELQADLKARLEAAGHAAYILDHGYCQSLYVTDPDGFNLEFTSDPEGLAEVTAWQKASAHETLQRWLAGDRTPNNDLHHRD